jgi:hypothetical protein
MRLWLHNDRFGQSQLPAAHASAYLHMSRQLFEYCQLQTLVTATIDNACK